ncbi:hypothetical protein JAAARDRAFT_178495 [Jaapia argillacea MUCL 33604]|uniref:Amidohydrolase-related domain-containing protein n=1 Tax=Jaapia argillacea MUCL 33604 TaxID=933084 RepID=A0A067PQB0_9AGAM|nr:hypothetical protein JAAARDRAFT_178495 [Jaapia argillacea MUCL 33604]
MPEPNPPILLRNGLLATYTSDDSLLSTPTARRVDVLVENNRIAAIKEPNTIVAEGALVIDCSNKWIAPGFVDTHRHVWMSVVDNQEDWTLSEYLAKFFWTTTGIATPEDVYIGELAGCLQALHGGTTTVVDHFHCANSPEHIAKAIQATAESGIRSMLCMARQSFPTSIEPLEFSNDVEVSKMQMDIFRKLASKDHGRLTEDGRVTLGLAYDVQGYDPEEDRRVLSFARELNIKPITLHYVGGFHGRGTGKKARSWWEAGLLKDDCILAHGNDLVHNDCDPMEWEILRKTGASIASTPENELGMGHGNPITYEAVRRGVKVGLGIDCSSILSTEMFPAMHFALQWERGHQYNNIKAASAFRLATLGGAEAAHVASDLGSIEVGKLADILLYDATSVNLASCSDPFRGIVIHATAEDVEWVIVNGEVVKKEGKLVRKEWSQVAKELKCRAAKIREQLSKYDLDERYNAIVRQFGLPVAN